MLLMISNSKPVQAFTPPRFLRYTTPASSTTTTFVANSSEPISSFQDLLILLDIKWYQLFFLLLLTFILLMLLFLSCRFILFTSRSKKIHVNFTQILLHIGNQHTSVILPIQRLQDRPESYQFSCTNFIQNMSVSRKVLFSGLLNIDWDLMITHTPTHTKMSMMNSCSLSLRQFYLLKRILASDFFTYPILYHDGKSIPMPVIRGVLQTVECVENAPLASAIVGRQSIIPANTLSG